MRNPGKLRANEVFLAHLLTSDRCCRTANPAKGGARIDYTIKGSPGLRLRVSRDRMGNIVRKWSLLYTPRDGGKKARVVLGSYPALSLKDARDAAKRHAGGIVDGADPAAEARAYKASATFGELSGIWLERHAKPKKRSWREDERMLKHDLLPALGHKKARAVTTPDITNIVDGIKDRGSPYQANRVLVLARSIFRWGIKRKIVTENPAAGIDLVAVEEKRKVFLNEAQIGLFWRGLLDAPMTEALRIALKLALLTGARINEVGLARKAEFDLKKHIWIIPGCQSARNIDPRSASNIDPTCA